MKYKAQREIPKKLMSFVNCKIKLPIFGKKFDFHVGIFVYTHTIYLTYSYFVNFSFLFPILFKFLKVTSENSKLFSCVFSFFLYIFFSLFKKFYSQIFLLFFCVCNSHIYLSATWYMHKTLFMV